MRVRRRGEEGSALVLALFFTVIFSLFVVEVLTFADVGLKAAKALRERRSGSYAADGALDAAVHRFRSGGPCDDFVAPRGPDGQPVGGEDLVVRCQKRAGARSAGTPAHALLSLGTDPAEEGITTTTDMRVRGDVHSHSSVAAGGTLVVEGAVAARGECRPAERIETVPTAGRVACANTGGGADPVRGLDPDLTSSLRAAPVHRTVPACPPGWLVALAPGHYDDGVALSALTDGSCPGRVVWFQPGTYHFDLGFRGGPATWTVDDATVNVVAGAPKGWEPDARRPRPTLNAPGGCLLEGDRPPVTGAQLVFGGRSHLHVEAGKVEVCAPPGAGEQQVAVLGLPPERPLRTLRPAGVARVDGFTSPERALLIGESAPATARATLDEDTSAASITLAGFRPRLPVGAVLDAAVLRVAHHHEGAVSDVRVTLGSNASTCGPVALPVRRATDDEDRVDLRACGVASVAALADLTVTFGAAASAGGVAHLDGMWIEVTHRVPVTRKPFTVAAADGFTTAEHALELGEEPVALTADARLDENRRSASLSLSGYGEPRLPPSTVIDVARLRVAHHDAGGVSGVSVTPSFPGATCGRVALTLRPNGTGEDVVDLAACGLRDAGGLEGLSVTYSVAADDGGQQGLARLDAIWLEVLTRSTPVTQAPGTATTDGFSEPARVAAADGETADAELGTTRPAAWLATGGYQRRSAAAVDTAVLRVVHAGDGQLGSVTVRAALPGGGGCTLSLPVRRGALAEDRVDLRACGVTSGADLADLEVRYEAALEPGGTGGTARLDALVLDVVHRPAVTRPPAEAASASFSPPDAARAIDGVTADAPVNPDAEPASIHLSRFAGVPAGAVLDAAVLRVVHARSGPVGDVTVDASFPGGRCALTLLPPGEGQPVEQHVDLRSCGLVDRAQLDGLAVRYDARAGDGAGVLHLDGLVLELVFRPPALQPLSGCTVTGPYPSTGCALVKVSSARPETRFVTAGTVYAPSAALDIAMRGVTAQVLPRGLVARTMRLGVAADRSYSTRPTVGIPPEAVQFTVYRRDARTPEGVVSSAGFDDAAQPPGRATSIDGAVARAELDEAAGRTSASLTLGAYPPGGAATGDVDGTVLVVVHRADAVAVAVTLLLADGTQRRFSSTDERCQLCVDTSGDLREDRIELAGLAAAQLDGARATYEVDLGDAGRGAADLDGIALEVFSGPLVRARVAFDRERSVVEGWNVLR